VIEETPNGSCCAVAVGGSGSALKSIKLAELARFRFGEFPSTDPMLLEDAVLCPRNSLRASGNERVDPSISLLPFARGKSLTLRVGTSSPKISLTGRTGGGLVIS
jgi:hypothetical protein